MKTVGHCVIIGSSSGLGAALVEKFLSEKKFFVIGIARRRLDQIENGDRWVASGRYRHVEVDITSDECKDILTLLCKEFAAEPICVIFNAARVETDINKDGSFNYGIFSGVNRVGIDGLGNIIGAFEDHFLKHGGILIGISSFSAFMPPVFEPRIAYPASKAYMDMALRCLRVIWDKVSIVTVHLGHMKNSGGKENIHFFLLRQHIKGPQKKYLI